MSTWHKPTDSTTITSPFGPRKAPKTGATTNHLGTDYRAPEGANVYAIGDGTVETVSKSTARGNYIRVRHSGNVVSLYQHLQAAKVAKGDTVRAGQIIGLAGATGNVTGAHLHLEVIVSGHNVDPAAFLASPPPGTTAPAAKPGAKPKAIKLGDRELRRGLHGDDVKELQRVLNAWYPSKRPALVQDGDYGFRTESRVAYFQGRAGLRVDGIAGRKTLGALGVKVRF